MEATVADIIYGSVYGDATDSAPTSPISEWFEYDLTRVPAGTTQIDHNTYVAEVTALDILRTLSDGKHSASVYQRPRHSCRGNGTWPSLACCYL